jgi:hypothetical protein
MSCKQWQIDTWLAKQHKENFGQWLKDKLRGHETNSNELDLLAMGPSLTVLMYKGYDINAYTFYMRKQDAKSTNQNSGVKIKAYDSENRPQTNYGFIKEI